MSDFPEYSVNGVDHIYVGISPKSSEWHENSQMERLKWRQALVRKYLPSWAGQGPSEKQSGVCPGPGKE